MTAKRLDTEETSLQVSGCLICGGRLRFAHKVGLDEYRIGIEMGSWRDYWDSS